MTAHELEQRIEHKFRQLRALKELRVEIQSLEMLAKEMRLDNKDREFRISSLSTKVKVPDAVLIHGVTQHIYNLRCRHRKLAESLRLATVEWEVQLS